MELSEDGSFNAGNDDTAAYLQLRSYTINEYFLQGHVENKLHYNGASTLSVSVEDGATWIITGESLVTKLSIADGAFVKGTLTTNPDGTLKLAAGSGFIPAGEYGTIESAASGEMSSASGEASGSASGETTGTASGEASGSASGEAS